MLPKFCLLQIMRNHSTMRRGFLFCVSSSSLNLKPQLSRQISNITIASALQDHIDSINPSPGQAIQTYILKSGFSVNTNISIKLQILHLKCGCLSYARKVFDEMPNLTLSAYNYMIAGYFKQGQMHEALEMVSRLAWSGEKPDGFTLSMALKLSSSLGLASEARQAHAIMVKLICYPDDVLFAALIDSYVKNGDMSYAKSVFDIMPEKNLVCSTALIVGYMNQGCFRDAEALFESFNEKDTVIFNAMIEGYSRTLEASIQSLKIYKIMRCSNFWPSISTFVSVLGACTLVSEHEFGQQVHVEIIKTDSSSHVKSGSALVDMYCKCGMIEDARRVFDFIPEKNVISWTSMIDGYGKNGYPEHALQLFLEMQRATNVRPNHATFLIALSACGHAGLVSEGKRIFKIMETDYLLKPQMEHYACMVDLLGRMGNLKEAYDFIKCIPEKPNSDVWTALLAASRLHGDVEMADIAADEVFKITENGRSGAYVSLSNTFAAAGKWYSVSEVRGLMVERGVSKSSGSSWVETG